MIYNKHLQRDFGKIIIAENVSCLSIDDLIENSGIPDVSGRLTIEVASGVRISSTSTGTPAASLLYHSAMDIIIVNKGEITGMGGNGGSGAALDPSNEIQCPSVPGGGGGTALSLGKNVTIFNHGIIAGGGGGGGGGGSGEAFKSMGGGGGGGGSTYGVGGAVWYLGSYYGTPGASGGHYTGGAGGPGGSYNQFYGGAGGAGGSLGMDGGSGGWGLYSQWAPSAGGVAGYYINGISYAKIASPYVSKGNCTISNGTPGVVTLSSHGLMTGAQVSFQTTDELPSPLVAGTTYYAIKNDDNTMWLATSLANAIAGTKIATTTDGSGTHSMYYHGTFLGRVV